MNDQDDINPHRDPPPRWATIGCLVTVIIVIGLLVWWIL